VPRLQALSPTRLVLEAPAAWSCPCWPRSAVAVNPRQVRNFAKALGKLARTGAIDAQVLAHFAEAVRPTVRPLPDATTQAWPLW
jgi:transposase